MMFRKFKKGKCLWFNHWDVTLVLGLILLIIISFLNVANAADYPTKPIQMIVGFAPGGGADITARFICDRLSVLLGQPVVVVNKPGGGGAIGTYVALASAPDGYTILVTAPPQFSAPLVTKGVTFDILRDFTMINLAVTSPTLVVVKKDAPWQTLEEFIAEVKKNPGKLTFSSSGYGGTPHFAGELFKMYTATDLTHVPLDGTAPSLTAVLGGHISMTFPEYGAVYRYLEAGSLRVLAVMDKKRLKQFPDAPTTVEKGFPNLIIPSYEGFAVSVKTPRAIVEKLEKFFKEALNDKEIIEKFEKTGWIVENLGSKDAAEFLANDLRRKSEVAKAARMVPK